MWVRAHAGITLRRQLSQFRDQAVIVAEQFLRPVTPKPRLQLRQMFFLFHADRHLVRAEGALDNLTVNLFRSGPSLRRL